MDKRREVRRAVHVEDKAVGCGQAAMVRQDIDAGEKVVVEDARVAGSHSGGHRDIRVE